MPTVMSSGNIRVMVRTNDHAPAPVHVVGPDAEARIRIEDMAVMSYGGFSRRALAKIVAKLAAHKDVLQEAWDEIHEEG